MRGWSQQPQNSFNRGKNNRSVIIKYRNPGNSNLKLPCSDAHLKGALSRLHSNYWLPYLFTAWLFIAEGRFTAFKDWQCPGSLCRLLSYWRERKRPGRGGVGRCCYILYFSYKKVACRKQGLRTWGGCLVWHS